jgi:hypothetical protein
LQKKNKTLPTLSITKYLYGFIDNVEKNDKKEKKKKSALAGNRTRVARVASEHSTTEPPVLDISLHIFAFSI